MICLFPRKINKTQEEFWVTVIEINLTFRKYLFVAVEIESISTKWSNI